MTISPNPPVSQTLGDFNIGLAAAIGLLNPLSAQLDLLLSLGLGPLMADLSVQLNVSLAMQATLSLQISDPTVSLQLAISALAQLQAALSAALSLPTISVSISAELSASVALSAALALKLGGLQLLIQAALQIKIAAMKFAADFALSLSLPGFSGFTFQGEPLSTTGGQINALFSAGWAGFDTDPNVWGIVLMVKDAALFTSMSAIITV
jgi:hypothetical protein